MLTRCMLLFGLTLSVMTAIGCGGSTGSPPGTATTIIQAPVLGPAEGSILNAAVVYPPTNRLFIGDNPTDLQLVGILGFDISGVTSVHSAVLTFYSTMAAANDPWSLGPLLVDHIDGGGTLDMTDADVPALIPAAHELDSDQPTWSLDVTALVAADVAAGRTTSTFRLRFEVPSNNDGIHDQFHIATSLHMDPALHPTLVVEQPVP